MMIDTSIGVAPMDREASHCQIMGLPKGITEINNEVP
jgi:hypothetical protein